MEEKFTICVFEWVASNSQWIPSDSLFADVNLFKVSEEKASQMSEDKSLLINHLESSFGASGTGVSSIISPMLRVFDEMYKAQDELIKDMRNHDNKKQEWIDDELRKLYETHEHLLDLVSLFCYVSRPKYLPLGPTSAKLINIYRDRHHINAATGLNDPAVATGISDLIYDTNSISINQQ